MAQSEERRSSGILRGKTAALKRSKTGLDMRRAAQGEAFSAIVKVNQPDYVPEYVDLRVRITSDIFTANITRPVLQRLEEDPAVVSISAGKPLRSR